MIKGTFSLRCAVVQIAIALAAPAPSASAANNRQQRA